MWVSRLPYPTPNVFRTMQEEQQQQRRRRRRVSADARARFPVTDVEEQPERMVVIGDVHGDLGARLGVQTGRRDKVLPFLLCVPPRVCACGGSERGTGEGGNRCDFYQSIYALQRVLGTPLGVQGNYVRLRFKSVY